MTADDARAESVLVVEDDPRLLKLTTRILQIAGFAVTACADGEAAIALLGTERFDVIVSDLAMPRLSGVELLRILREKQIEIPVVLVSGSPTLDSAMKAVEYGAFKYLTKPVERETLVTTIQQACRLRDARSGPRTRGGDAGEPRGERAIEAGAVLGERYRLRRQLGVGGMGEVWEASHSLTGRPVALKLLHPSLNARPEMRRRLLREARAVTAFVHPNVIEVFDVFELTDGTPVVVMELLRGVTLRARLDELRRLDLEEACRAHGQVVSAVGTGHAHGVIHRDLKPENVMLCAGGAAKVMDYGIAKLVHADPRDATSGTGVGVAVGTLGYMSPEQACGEANIGHGADVWSIGAMLYEALSGARAVPGTTLGQIIAHLLTERPVPLAQRAPDVPPALAALVDAMLERDPGARPADLREVRVELARHTSDATPSFGAPAPATTSEADGDEDFRRSIGTASTQIAPPAARRRG